MDNTYYVQAAVRERMENGPMGPHFDFIAGELERRGYSRHGVRRRMHAADAFGQWLLREGLGLADVTASVVKRYVADIPQPKGLRAHTCRGFHCVMELLRKHGAIPPLLPKAPVPENAIDAFLTELERHMEEIGGLAARTRAFLKAVFPNGILDWSSLRAQHVVEFVRERTEKLAPSSRKSPIGGIRVLLRFLSNKDTFRMDFRERFLQFGNGNTPRFPGTSAAMTWSASSRYPQLQIQEAGAIMPCSCCWCALVCVPARLPGFAWKTSIGEAETF